MSLIVLVGIVSTVLVSVSTVAYFYIVVRRWVILLRGVEALTDIGLFFLIFLDRIYLSDSLNLTFISISSIIDTVITIVLCLQIRSVRNARKTLRLEKIRLHEDS